MNLFIVKDLSALSGQSQVRSQHHVQVDPHRWPVE